MVYPRTSDSYILNGGVGDRDICVICGFEIDHIVNLFRGWGEPFRFDAVNCGHCDRRSHRACVDYFGIKRCAFKCSLIPRHLGLNQTELFSDPDFEPVYFDRSVRVLQHNRCLICGDDIVGFSGDVIKCVKTCKMGVHLCCLAVMCEVLEEDFPPIHEYCCNMILYQFKPVEVVECILESGSLVAGLNLDSYTFDHAMIESLRDICKVRGKVTSMRYFNKRQRFENDELQCKKCGVWYGTDETDHMSKYCGGTQAYPISDGNKRYPQAKLARYSWGFLPP